ncbi:MAG: hypothetical protein RL722_1121 [Pseudomonadota bacterium]
MNSPFDLPGATLADADPSQTGMRAGASTEAFWQRPGRFEALGAPFVRAVPTEPLPEPRWVIRNTALAEDLGLADWLAGDAARLRLAGHPASDGRLPLASAYSGHQFGVWAGQLGDGRAHLLGEVIGRQGPMELQLKGAGHTPYSRMGDGRAVLRSSIREYLCSEAMAGLGIPTTRALALLASDLPVRRERVETAAVVTRVAPSFLRFGHFEHYTHTARNPAALQTLLRWTLRELYPDLQEAPQPALALLAEVARRSADLMVDWMGVGFCHGVMNSDNMSILGLTLDYGPYGFLDGYDPGHICNHSDHQGRYAFARQPQVTFWNLHALVHGLLPAVAVDLGRDPADLTDAEDDPVQAAALDAIEVYRERFTTGMRARLCAKLGLSQSVATAEADEELANDWLKLLAAERVDHAQAWRRLCAVPALPAAGSQGSAADQALRDLFIDQAALSAWLARWRTRLAAEASLDAPRQAAMQRINPLYILRNHLAEIAIQRAEAGDYAEVQRLADLLTRPYDAQPGAETYAALAPDWASSLSISCSS